MTLRKTCEGNLFPDLRWRALNKPAADKTFALNVRDEA
jgi:hypothetical protein